MIQIIKRLVYDLLSTDDGVYRCTYTENNNIVFDILVSRTVPGERPLKIGRLEYEIEFFDDYCVVHIPGFPSICDTTFHYNHPEFPFDMIGKFHRESKDQYYY